MPRVVARPRVWTVLGVAVSACIVEVALTFGRAYDLFLSRQEVWLYVLSAFTSWAGAVFTGHLVGRGVHALVPSLKTRARIGGVVAAAVMGVLAWESAGGRRVVDYRWFVAIGAGGVAGAVATSLLRRWETGSSWYFRRVPLVAFASALLVADALVLHRLYPAFHLALVLTALVLYVAASFAGAAGPWVARSTALLLFVGFATVATAAVGVFAGLDNGRFVAERHAALTGKVLRLLPRDTPPVPEGAEESPEGVPEAVEGEHLAGPDWRERDVLLITVDALRADVLTPVRMPQLTQLAERGVVFERAYTPTPHTSYALSSLLTGKFVRPVLALPGEERSHPSIAALLRGYGYRTAAFYPPAIFFVDSARFGSLASDGFDFEYRKTMFAPAEGRVRQLRRYLHELEGGAERRVFAWVHLFEPHEPYDPPAAFHRGDSARQRYDGEVAAADAAIGELVRVFRAERPDAVVVVSADHGEEFGEHGGYHHGTTLYDEQIAVPLVWSASGLEARRVTAPVEIVDIATTLLGALGIPPDARMRGDDLGGLLLSDEAARPRFAFAGVGDERMVSDGSFKLVCARHGACRLYDLRSDPRERTNIADSNEEQTRLLRSALRGFAESIPEVEALTLGDEGAWPAALAQAELGEADGAALQLLLASERSDVRAAAARLLGQCAYRPALATLLRLRGDADASVSREAALSAAVLGDRDARVYVREALEGAEGPGADADWRRRGALALAAQGEAAVTALVEVLADETAPEEQRRAAATGLASARSHRTEARDALLGSLDAVNLRVAVLEALRAFPGALVTNAVASRLEEERYLGARTLAAELLVERGDRRALGLVRRWLGTPEPMPQGVRLLLALGQRGRGQDWSCDAEGCVLGEDARIVAAEDGEQAVFWVQGPGRLSVGERVFALSADAHQVALRDLPTEPSRLSFGGEGALRGVAIIPQTAELPPPPPEPWEDEE